MAAHLLPRRPIPRWLPSRLPFRQNHHLPPSLLKHPPFTQDMEEEVEKEVKEEKVVEEEKEEMDEERDEEEEEEKE